MKKFLRYESNQYLSGRGRESEGERPLKYCSFGARSYSLPKRLGHYVRFAGLYWRRFQLIWRSNDISQRSHSKSLLIPTTAEFVDHLREVTPDSLQYLITDWFEEITLYKNKVKDAVYAEDGDEFTVEFTIESQKFKADSIGEETEVELKEWVDIGVFNEKGVPCLFKET